MAVPTDTISTEIIPNYTRKLRDDVAMATPVWEWLFDTMESVDGGSTIKEQIQYKLSPNADNYPGGVAPLQADFADVATEATFPPSYYWYSCMIPDTLKILGRGEGEVINLFNGQFENALQALTQKLGTDSWADGTQRNGAPIIWGLAGVNTSGSDPGGGAFGGITRASSSGSFSNPTNQAFWNANVLTVNGGSQTVWTGAVNPGTSTALSFQAVMALVAACTVGIYRPKLLVGGLTAWTAFHNLLVQTVRQAPLQEEQGIGSPQISFAGIPVLCDVFASTGVLAAVNELYKLVAWEDGFFAQMEPVRPYNSLCTIYYGLVVMRTKHTRPNTSGYMTGILS